MIFRINNPKKKLYETEGYKFLEKIFAQHLTERQKTETHVSGNEDVNSPMYRNNTGYNAIIEDGEIKNLIAHYYFNG